MKGFDRAGRLPRAGDRVKADMRTGNVGTEEFHVETGRRREKRRKEKRARI